MTIPTWAILRAAGVPDDEHADVMRRAERMVEAWKPDGAREYVGVTPEWSAWKGAGILPGIPLRQFFGDNPPTPPENEPFEDFENA